MKMKLPRLQAITIEEAVSLLVTLVLLVGLAAAVYLVQQEQDLRSQALLVAVNLTLVPANIAVERGEEIQIDVFINTNGRKVITAQIQIDYDENLFEFVSLTKGSTLNAVLEEGTADESGQDATLLPGNGERIPLPAGIQEGRNRFQYPEPGRYEARLVIHNADGVSDVCRFSVVIPSSETESEDLEPSEPTPKEGRTKKGLPRTTVSPPTCDRLQRWGRSPNPGENDFGLEWKYKTFGKSAHIKLGVSEAGEKAPAVEAFTGTGIIATLILKAKADIGTTTVAFHASHQVGGGTVITEAETGGNVTGALRPTAITIGEIAQAAAAQNGSITVCKAILDSAGNITDGSEVAGATFTIPGIIPDPPTSQGAPAGQIPNSSFTTPLTLNADLFRYADGNDGHCVTYTNLVIGGYYYGQEQYDPDWEPPLYNDRFKPPVKETKKFAPYDTSLFDSDPENDIERNKNADGFILLREKTPSQTLVVLATLTSKCTSSFQGYTLRMGSGLFTNHLREDDRCALFSFSAFTLPEDFRFPEEWDRINTPIIVFMENDSMENLVEDFVDILGDVSTGPLFTARGYDATAVSGSFPETDDVLGGEPFYIIYVAKDASNTLFFALLGSATEEQKQLFEELVRSVEFF